MPGSLSTVVKINGCFAPDEDFDGQSYRLDWPGTNPSVAQDQALHPQPVMFTSPTTHGQNYQTAAFETDLPRIEAADSQANPPFCDRTTGANCVNPPMGAQFYPFYSTTTATVRASGRRAATTCQTRRTTSAAVPRLNSGRC